MPTSNFLGGPRLIDLRPALPTLKAPFLRRQVIASDAVGPFTANAYITPFHRNPGLFPLLPLKFGLNMIEVTLTGERR